MDPFRQYNIEIQGLKKGKYEYFYKIEDPFFELFEYSPVSRGKLGVELHLEREESHIALDFKIAGTVELTCDRSLELFDYPLQLSERMILKFGEEAQEVADDLEIIGHNTQTINIAHYIYEYIGVAIPMKKVRPDLIGEDENSETLVYSSRRENEADETTDPRWEALAKLKKHKR
jgi:uncharacterized protein